MTPDDLKPALLMLDDGACFAGRAVGAAAEAAGEVVFTTGMSGYQETLTDPSYFGQITVFTSAHIGNYGATPQDDEATAPQERRFGPCGAVFHDFFLPAEGFGKGAFPHWRAVSSLNDELARLGVTGICGIDTRALTLHLRRFGSRGGIISALDPDRASLLRRAKALPSMEGQDLAQHVTCPHSYAFRPKAGDALPGGPPAAGRKPFHVAVIDFGAKRSILLHLLRQNLEPTLWPAKASAYDILATRPDGVMLTNGPGDPAACSYAIETVRKLLGRVPLFGICLGHQLLGLAVGGKTDKLHFGHHGLNHPVKDVTTGRVAVTSQNHGFVVEPGSLPASARPTHWNLNDGSLEGLELTDAPAFSVQFHPEATPGTWDVWGLFDKFRALIEESK
ncbi:MAG: glutamine-hydrolyzing carbamoyl-phosphate synthase small subunit [Deltaproteobacteria bacterium]|jgi:carbamoyl-phosphate synthase small subunit|nr:glutamine-hydrolyzing carbamoyl-phosphate synthase small subunit [Deltaproteobacteria bacterium]